MDPTYITFFVLSGISIICSFAVLLSLYRFGSLKSCFTFLLLWFHGSMIGQEITVLPLIYKSSRSSCVTMEFLHYFFGLMNIIIVSLLVEAHRSSLFTDYFKSRKYIMKYGSLFIICFPLITAIPFAVSQFTINYDDDTTAWCVLPYDRSTTWMIWVYYFWVWFFLFLSIIGMAYSGFYVFKSDRLLAQKYMSTIGLYVIVAILSWIPRSVERVSQMHHEADRSTYFVAFLPISISGILYSVIYMRERNSLSQFREETAEDAISAGSFSFTWEKDDFPEDLMSAANSGSNFSMDRSIHPPSPASASSGERDFRSSWFGRGSSSTAAKSDESSSHKGVNMLSFPPASSTKSDVHALSTSPFFTEPLI